MASITANSHLVSILFITRSVSGPNLTFHYPPRPRRTSTFSLLSPANGGTSSSSSSASSSSSSCEDEDEDDNNANANDIDASKNYDIDHAIEKTTDSQHKQKKGHKDEDDNMGEGKGGHAWDKILGFKADFLAGVLAPKVKGRFEVSVNDMVFLGQPVRVRPDGTWRKRKKRRRESRSGGSEDADLDLDGEKRDGKNAVDRDGEASPTERDSSVQTGGITKSTMAGRDHDDADDERDDDDINTTKGSTDEAAMSMFHLVFVLNPPELEYHIRTTQMFECVVKRFSRALKYEQAKDGYVWREAERICRLKEQAAQKGTGFLDLWRQILDRSSLAYAISRIYSDISQSKIAHVLLNNNLALSLQIPVVSDIAVLPSLADPQVPGIPLTTANCFGDDEVEGGILLARHFTLLFLEDVDSILKDIAAENTESTASLSLFVKSVRPTISFLQISNQCGLPLHEIQFLARHLIHWRKARAIPPIHPRDTYIVSPNADMKRLSHLIPQYAKQFHTLPTLPKILSLLSGKPKPFATLIPSRDHRNAYLGILTWLIQYSLVTQLRNFAWIKVPRAIKIAVHKEQTVKGAAAGVAATGSSGAGDSRESSSTDGGGNISPPGSPSVAMINSTSSLTGLDDLRHRSEGDIGSGDADELEFQDSFILEPSRASGLESAWLEMAMRPHPPEVRALFERMLKYLNGRHALEKISVREGISRKEVRKTLLALDEVLVYARHW